MAKDSFGGADTGSGKGSGEIQEWLLCRLAERLKVDKNKIGIHEPLYNYGLDSAEAVIITGEMSEWLGRTISPTLVWDYPSIAKIVHFLTAAPGEPDAGNTNQPENKLEPVAIIGIGCRFPGAAGPAAFWNLLKNGVDAITEMPARRAGQSEAAGMGGYLEEVEKFDAQFFGISPREAAGMDPQQRLLLETAWEALEDGGQVPEQLAGQRVGVFVGISGYDYGTMVRNYAQTDIYAATGNALSIAANRISYLLNFRGPSMAIDTACSSSLVAVHLACQSLRHGESSLALAGGVNLLLSTEVTDAFSKAGMLAPDGRCKTFAAGANGYVRGEGVGVVVLKLLSQALRDGDPVYALIPGSAVNQDGRSNGLTAPNGQAQEEVVREAYRRAGVSPAQIQYIEAHGTGTSLGDPIEVNAVGKVLAAGRSPQSPCRIGSAKTNIGHLEAAAGIAGLIKVALALKHRQIPPSLHFDQPNPYIPFPDLPLEVQTELGPWPEKEGPLLAGVSSFGFGGTNAHVVLQSVQPAALKKYSMAGYGPQAEYLLPVSAASEEALQALARSYRDYLMGEGGNVPVKDIGYTAAIRRSHHRCRLATVVRSRQECIDFFTDYLNGEAPGLAGSENRPVKPPKLVFVFSGQGPQWWAMGRELFQTEPVFREAIEECDALFHRHADWSLITELMAEKSESRLDQTEYVQPALFSIQVALARLWLTWGIEPAAVVGHSMGEVAAAHIAGALSLADAVRVIFHRSRLMQRTTGQGKTIAVGLAWEEANSLLQGYEKKVSVACYNGPTSLILSGEPDSMDEIMATLQQKNVFCKALPVKYAFHSPQMEPLLAELTESLQGLQPQPAGLPVYSTVTGRLIDGQELDAGYWAGNLRKSVLFSTAVEALAQDDYNVFVEISPHPVLAGAVRQSLVKAEKDGIVLPSIRRQEPERAVILNSLGKLYALGYSVKWKALYPEGGKCISLPAYPWQREAYWFESVGSRMVYTPAAVPAVDSEWDRWLYKLDWQPAESSLNPADQGGGSWLIFTRREGIGEAIARRLNELGKRTVLAYPGESFQQEAANVFIAGPSREDMKQLLQAVRDSCQGIIHTWSIRSAVQNEVTLADLETAQSWGCLHILTLIQAIRAAGPMPNWPRLWLITRDSQAVLPAGAGIDVAQAPLWGLGRTIALEQQELWGGLIDIDSAMTDELSAQMAVDDLFRTDEEQLAYRQGVRYAARLQRDSASRKEKVPFSWPTNAAYLITGGLGDLGMQVARWMAAQGARRLILLGRTELPPRAVWGDVLSQGGRLARQITGIKELEAMGTSIHLAAVDVADATQLAAFLQNYCTEGWPPIRGVVHAAGTVADQLLTECGQDSFREVLRPKIMGAWNLHNLLADVPLDFFLLFSSVSAVLSSPRLGSYAAANAFLDALAHYRRGLKLPALSIDWGPWAEIGMAARFGVLASTDGTGMKAIAPEQGLRLLENLFRRDLTQILAMDVDWVRWHTVYQQMGETALLAELLRQECEAAATVSGDGSQEPSFRSEWLAAGPDERRQLLLDSLCEQTALVLQLPKARLDVQTSLHQLGFDSIMAIELKNRLEKTLGIVVPMVHFLQGPSITGLADQIQELLAADAPASVIPPATEQEYYPVSSAQKRMFILNQFERNDTVYNNFVAFKAAGDLDRSRFEQALNRLIQRHETLRTSFTIVDGKPVQRVHPAIEFAVEFMQEKGEAIPEILQKFSRPFDLSQAPLFRVGLVEIAAGEHIVLFDMHHIISDGVTADIFIKELAGLYEGSELPAMRLQYKDFAVWQERSLQTAAWRRQEEYWLQALAGELPVLNLPTDYPRPSVRSFTGDVLRFSLEEKLTEQLNRLARENGTTLYMVLLAAYTAVLSQYTGQEDIIVGSPITGRPYADLHNIIGVFVNTLAMRNYPEKEKNFRQFLQEVKENALRAYENQDYQFEELVDKLDIPRNLSRNPLFDTMFALQSVDMAELTIGDLRFSRLDFYNKIAKFDVTLEAIERNNRLDFTLEYDTKLFKPATIDRLRGHLEQALKRIVERPDSKLADIELLTAAEKEQLLTGFNPAPTEYPRDKTIPELFEEQAAKNPDRIAVTFGDRQLTYAELNSRANQLARALRCRGVTANTIVGLLLDRSPAMITGILGILKAGGAYLPIDPDYPADRIAYMLADSGAQLLITRPELSDAAGFAGDLLDVDDPALYQGDTANLAKENTAPDLAYVIYTSGSTGKPKGNLTMHTNVVRVVKNTNYITITGSDVLLQLSNYAFDGSVFDIYGALLNGARLVLIDKAAVLDMPRLARIIETEQVTVFFITTALFNTLVDVNLESLKQVRKILFGGEAASPRHVEKAFETLGKGRVVNMYGPTETTVFATYHEINGLADTAGSIPIGKPVANTRLYILDRAGRLQPVGVPGELCIAGDGLAQGYLNRPELTAEKFVADPFVTGERMYRSGDLARWRPDGTVEFIGRMDQQIKLRGFRVELGEIETELLKQPSITEALVVAKQEASGYQYLCAYIVAEREVAAAKLKEELQQSLPDYMIPASVMQLEKMPLTPNGKIDRKALPEPAGGIRTGTEYVAPRNEAEARMAQVWQDVLAVEKVGMEDNFFELGGHSLKAIMLAAKIHKEFSAEVPLTAIFKAQTVGELSKTVAGMALKDYMTIEPAAEQEYYPVSSAQKRMFILNRLEPENTAYNMPAAFKINGFLDKLRLEGALQKLIARHEALRTSFELIDGEPVQRIHPAIDFTIECQQGTEAVLPVIFQAFVRPFDLSKAPLLRVGLVEVTPNQYVVLFDMHHIIADGVSIGIIVRELAGLYEGRELPALTIQYKDFSVWQNNLLTTERLKQQEDYWLQTLAGELPVLNLPGDYLRPPVRSFEGDELDFAVPEELTAKLNQLAVERGTTLYMVLLAAYNVVLSRYSGQEDIIVGTPIAGRPHADLENMVGMFVNTLAMRNFPAETKSFREFLQEVKANALAAYEHQDYQFEELVDNLDIPRDLSRNPVFSTLFTLQNVDIATLSMGDLQFIAYEFDNKTAKFDLTLRAVERNNRLEFTLEYYSKLFKTETVRRLGKHFVNVLNSIVEQPEATLSGINMLSQKEKRQVLIDFNNRKLVCPVVKTIPQLFQEQASKNPQRIAVTFGERQVTYQELNRRANQLARVLRGKGVGPNSIVGLMVERSPEMMAGILGILKAGGAYLPIDPGYGRERIAYMLENSQAKILLTQTRLKDKAPVNMEIIDLTDSEIDSAKSSNVKLLNQPADLAYVIYTSGTTGRPKGVMIEQRQVVNLVYGLQDQIYQKYDSFLNVALLSPYVFDASVKQIFPALLLGHNLCIVPEESRFDRDGLLHFYRTHHIDISDGTPAHIKIFNARSQTGEFPAVKEFLIGGEALSYTAVQEFIGQFSGGKVTVTNVYGPTECCDVATVYPVDCTKSRAADIVPIGRPLANVEIYILGQDLTVLPVNAVGEVYIGGQGVGRGYLNQPEMTAEKFVTNPFLPGTKMYRTGDLARWLPDGTIDFLGRVDHQVKIRGFRIELGEIETQLLTYAGIKEAVAVVREDPNGQKYLCAYLVAGQELTVAALREHLAPKLPDYMIPAAFVQLAKMPLTGNGKVDRRALPEPDGGMSTGTEYVAPGNEMEAKMVQIWQEVLGTAPIGLEDNFFALGGHSLKAVTLAARIKREYGTEVPLTEVFKAQTVRDMCRTVAGAAQAGYDSIQPVAGRETYPVSSAQKRMFILNQFEPGDTTYNMPAAFKMEGLLDPGRLTAAWQKLIRRHEILRTSFEVIDGEPLQRVHNATKFAIESIAGAEAAIPAMIRGFVRPFDLSRAPLLRVGLVKLAEDQHVVLFDMHHIIGDGVSMRILVKELTWLYEGQNLPELRIQYKDFSAWQNNLLASERFKQQETYWLQALAGELPVLNLPTDYSRPAVRSFAGERLRFALEPAMTAALNQLALETGTTLYMVLLAAYNVLLAKYSGQEDIIVGSPVAGRPHADLENMLGMFVNTLAMRNYPEQEKSFLHFLQEVKENALKAYENQDYQFEELVDKLDIPRNLSRNPLFDAMFALQNTEQAELAIGGLHFSRYEFDSKIAKFDLTLEATERNNRLEFSLEYDAKLFKPATAGRLKEHYVNILTGILVRPDSKLADIELLTAAEKDQLLTGFNPAPTEYPRDQTIPELFEEQAAQNPDRIAVTFGEQQLTYAELNSKANQLARALRRRGVTANTIVGLLLDRSPAMITGILGILKAGGAYLPIDPDYPADRIAYMLADSGAQLLITRPELSAAAWFAGELLDVDDPALYQGDTANLAKENTARDLAYVIYTSGSTGKPKGNLTMHTNVVRVVKNTNYITITGSDVLLQLSNYAFDGSVFDIYGALLNGAGLVLIDKAAVLDMPRLTRIIEIEQVTVFFITTALFNTLVDVNLESLKQVRKILFGGEAASPRHVKKAFTALGKGRVVNMYGPTETTVFATYHEINHLMDTEGSIPIGKPVGNTRLYILDRAGRLQPVGVPGELCIAGDGLAQGYLNRPELTAEKFVADPFAAGERMYRSGDLARWKPDGTVEFIGRMDHQIKLRGFRVELGEIEAELLKQPSVTEALVIAKQEASGYQYLCAYIVAEQEVAAARLKEELQQSLPDYMIPASVIQLEKMPLTPNGKIDRKALPEPAGRIRTGREYVAPRNEAEAKMAQVWQEVLGVEKVGREDNFFELGGHSLKAIMLAAKIHKEFGTAVPLTTIFKAQTVGELSKTVAGTAQHDYAAIEPAAEQEYYPVSPAQMRMFILNQFEAQDTVYNMPAAFMVEGRLDRNRFEQAVKELMARHESLRTSFALIDGEPMQTVHPEIDFSLGFLRTVRENIPDLIKNFVQPFDLGQAPLFRVTLAEAGPTSYIVLFDMHHIIADGVSMGILVKELAALYEGRELPALRIQYKDFSVWQKQLLASERLKQQEAYWLQTLSGELPVLNLPGDYPRPAVRSFEGDRFEMILDEEVTAGLNKLAAQSGTTLYMVLLAAYNVLLARYSGQEDIIVGTPIAGRPHADLENVIGMFVNTLALRNFPAGTKSFRDFLQEVKENALAAYEHQDYQFEELVDKLGTARTLNRNPLFDTMFTLQNVDIAPLSLGGLQFVPYELKNNTAKFDLTCQAVEQDRQLIITLEYYCKLFSRDMVERLAKHFSRILHCIAAQPQIELGAIELLSAAERQQILVDFNRTQAAYPQNRTVVSLFEEQAAKAPENTAAALDLERLSYQELNGKANQLARQLRQKGIKANHVVGILAERSPAMLVGLLGILKAGGAYLPIDPEYPADRVGYMLADSGATVLLTQRHLAGKAASFAGATVDLDDSQLYNGDRTNLYLKQKPDDLVYVIYTSGSTGKPKGVEIEHASLVNLVTWHQRTYNIRATDRATLLAGPAFDAAVWEIWPYLTAGAGLYIPNQETRASLRGLIRWLRETGITASFMPTPLAEALLGEEWPADAPLQALLTGGDQLHRRPPRNLPFDLVNHYGPTESTVVATCAKVDPAGASDMLPSIGRPIDNTRIYIVGQNNQLQPVGVAGELCIGGDGLARGYLNRPELTAEKFTANPFIPGERMYRTGDLARWLPDGSLEYLGRLDQQVKIRGFRVELGEIEAELVKHPAVKETVVLAKDDGAGGKYLCAYILTSREVAVAELREHLSRVLPGYMVPAAFVELAAIPLTPNGKIDRNALPEPEAGIHTGTEYVAPANETEERMARLWQEVLGVERVGMKDNFFELGGHSLKTITLAARIHKEFGVEVALTDLFKAPTIQELVRNMAGAAATDYGAIEAAPKQEYYPVSSAQKRMFILSQLENNDTAYNMSAALQVEGPLDERRFDAAWQKLMQRHETLRTSFEFAGGEPVQRVHPAVEFIIERLQGAENELPEIMQAFVHPFDLSQAPLLRVGLLKLDKDRHVLFFDMHHIISDGVSMGILIKELAGLYEEKELPALKIQYKDFALWQNRQFRGEILKKQEAYWLQAFAGELPELNLPADYPRPAVRSFAGDRVTLTLGGELTAELNKLAGQTGTTLYMVLLAAYNVLLAKHSGQEELIVGTPIAGRPHADLENLIGVFVNTLALRNYPAGNKTFQAFLQEVKNQALAAYEHQDYPFEELVEKLNLARELNRNPLFDTMFALQNIDMAPLAMGDLQFAPCELANKTAKFDLTLYAAAADNGLELMLEYYTELFTAQTAMRLLEDYCKILAAVTQNKDILIKTIALEKQPNKRKRIQSDWNFNLSGA
ncbi:phosphopantetheine attachment site [Lucifera butyrica]|uniref:Phosphopantetheine attachment site n=1 Tax=Lucifera butyrica TaxID=1351585 RepID=A0A498R2W8_9FIRM|nr:non-ribosomal peptide synthetase/type I polyketide synthase [Lucifera butyrica]VBB05120.1 phosphopantetheine attachment site [Lucifera butyrica]